MRWPAVSFHGGWAALAKLPARRRSPPLPLIRIFPRTRRRCPGGVAGFRGHEAQGTSRGLPTEARAKTVRPLARNHPRCGHSLNYAAQTHYSFPPCRHGPFHRVRQQVHRHQLQRLRRLFKFRRRRKGRRRQLHPGRQHHSWYGRRRRHGRRHVWQWNVWQWRVWQRHDRRRDVRWFDESISHFGSSPPGELPPWLPGVGVLALSLLA